MNDGTLLGKSNITPNNVLLSVNALQFFDCFITIVRNVTKAEKRQENSWFWFGNLLHSDDI